MAILSFSTGDIILDSGIYYSPNFCVETKDSFLTIQVTLNSNSDIYVQSSVDGITFFDVPDSYFTCSPSGLQSYAECQPGLKYRLKCLVEILNVKILI